MMKRFLLVRGAELLVLLLLAALPHLVANPSRWACCGCWPSTAFC